MLRGMRRRFSQLRGEPLAAFVVRVLAVSPYSEEPEDDENYRPSLIVQVEPAAPDPPPGAIAIATLLFVEWAAMRLADATLPARLRALLPRLLIAVELGRAGPDQLAQHRRNQRERYFHHREAASYAVELHRDEEGLYVVVGGRVARGRWTESAALLEVATVAPYEALLRLPRPEQEALLAWQRRAAERWLAGTAADYPVASWDPNAVLAPPNE